jgi:hypothetical protein
MAAFLPIFSLRQVYADSPDSRLRWIKVREATVIATVMTVAGRKCGASIVPRGAKRAFDMELQNPKQALMAPLGR